MAIGASHNDIVRAIVIESPALAALGVTLGLPIAIMVSRMIRASLFEVSAFDATIYFAAAGGIVAIAVLASFVPARRVFSTSPTITLASE
jgi:putative ABC transport system permease protein